MFASSCALAGCGMFAGGFMSGLFVPGFLLGMLVLLLGALMVIRAKRRFHYYYGGGHGCGRGCGHRGFGGHGPGCGHRGGHQGGRPLDPEAVGKAAAEVFKRKVGVSPEQEDIVDHALADARAALKEAGKVMGTSRETWAEALKGEQIDEAALHASLDQQEEALRTLRRELLSAMKQIHAVLDPEQRARAAAFLGRTAPGWM